jgi:hypothetical protein
MLTPTLRIFTAALTLMGAAAATTDLPRTADRLRPHPAVRSRHRPAHELTDVCRVEPVVAAPAPIASAVSAVAAAASSCTDPPRASSEDPR